ncbi:MAG: hypothetical protein U0670_11055 [Anaerolineae bacterium]
MSAQPSSGVVPYAYHLNGQGNTFTTVRVLLLGLFMMYIGTVCLYVLHEGIKMIVGSVISGNSSYEQIVIIAGTFAAYAFTAYGYGYIAGQVIFSQIGKSQSTTQMSILSWIMGAASVAIYLMMRKVWMGGEAFDSVLDGFQVLLVALFMLLSLTSTPAALMVRTPVCPSCGLYMSRRELRRYKRSDQATVMEILNAHEYMRLQDIAPAPVGTAEKERLTVTLWYCPRCKGAGYVNAEVPAEKPPMPKRSLLSIMDVMYSAPVTGEDVEALRHMKRI